VAVLLLLVGGLSAQAPDPESVKVAFVFNLTKYVEWPQPRGELVIGFVGSGPMGGRLKSALAGRTSESRTIQVWLSPSNDMLARCDLLFVGEMGAKARRAVLEKVQSKSVLTVGDQESFAEEGGMVGLVKAGDHVQLEINLEAVQATPLKISSRLLKVAVLVGPAAGARN
jgi:hypothetical protein